MRLKKINSDLTNIQCETSKTQTQECIGVDMEFRNFHSLIVEYNLVRYNARNRVVLKDSTVQYITVNRSTVHHITSHHITAQNKIEDQHNTIQCSAVQCNTVRYLHPFDLRP